MNGHSLEPHDDDEGRRRRQGRCKGQPGNEDDKRIRCIRVPVQLQWI